MLELSSSKGIRIEVPVLSVSLSVEDHSANIQALKKGLIEHEASETGGVQLLFIMVAKKAADGHN